ncbi:putative ATP-grasp-modified RiPP [Amycolatopsis sp. H20-H5]|uniref:putative ATP-grasp-modified RiPP n=1 Tax=Amycolatopsis sp. H20-H5 TaxID=3046309 RepID=UPI002DBAA72F|nr:putative ATP-grasp-modified RiPP [Amycolatopsis sp. H20-H5]MEC3977751.1 putative ATP-grasp-modified RiPP [Amycolatopsis sp. H20-H5]
MTAENLCDSNPLASAPLTTAVPGTRATVSPSDQVVPFALARTVPLPRLVRAPRTATYSPYLQVTVDAEHRPLTETMEREWTSVGSEDSSEEHGHTEEVWGWEG